MLSPTPPIDRPSLHPGTGYLIGPRVPRGLAAVVEGLTREVLRHRPEDIYVFAAHHFEKLLKLREQYHVEEYSGREFNGEFGREINLWPTKKSRVIRGSSSSDRSLDKEIEIFEKRRKVPADVEESPEDVSAGGERQETSRQTRSRRSSPSTKRASKRSIKNDETTSNSRATKIVSQMSALRGHGRNIPTKDIKQELGKNKLNGEKGKTTDRIEKGIRGERRSRTRVPKPDNGAEEEIERATTNISDRTSTRRPLKKVRRIETESETETEREIAVKTRLKNGYERSSVKGDNASREAAIVRSGSRDKRSEMAARLSEHSSERKVSSRALSMDRIRAYVLRKFASTASLEVLRSPTYVEQVQEVIDRAAPIIKERLEEMRRPRGKRSRSVDLAWNEEWFRHHTRDAKRDDGGEEIGSRRKKKTERRKSGNGPEMEADTAKKGETEDSPKLEDRLTRRIDETIPNVEREEKRSRRRSVGSGKRLKKRDNDEHNDLGVIDSIDDDSKHSGKSEHESGATRDTLEARLTATQNILEGISMSTSELGEVRRIDPASSEPSESEISNNVNVVSLPIVRPPSSRSCRSTARNDTDSLTLPPISPEAPKSIKKKDELSLPVLPAANNGNHSISKSQEQDVSRDAEETSTMRDMEDITVLPEDEHEDTIADEKQDPINDRQRLISEVTPADEEAGEGDKDIGEELAERRTNNISFDRDLEEFEEMPKSEEEKIEEVFKDSLNVTPEVIDVPQRPDSLESDENEQERSWNDDVAPALGNTFDGLKDKLIEIEMAERNIEEALGGKHAATHDGGMTSEVEKSTTDRKISETKMSTNEAEKIVNAVKQSADDGKISNEEEKSTNDIAESTREAERIKSNVEKSMNETKNSMNTVEPSTNEEEKMKSTVETSINDTENLTITAEKSANDTERSINEVEGSKNVVEMSKNDEVAMKQAEISTKVIEEVPIEKKKSANKAGESTNEMGKLPNGVEELIVKHHVEGVQSMSSPPILRNKGCQIIETTVREADDKDDVTTSKSKAETTNGLSETTASKKAATQSKRSKINLSDEHRNGGTKAQKRRETDKLPVTTPLSLKIPFSYVLSEGSPCEIPDTVTTVIIPDRQCPSPVTSETELETISPPIGKEESTIHRDIAEDISSKDEMGDHDVRYGMEAFGEYICPESAVLPIDIDFMRGAKGAKSGQDIMITHQDLDRIKEEGEEEDEEKGDDERAGEGSRREKDDVGAVTQNQEKKLATLEGIVEHEENDETDTRAITGSKETEEISSVRVPEDESQPDNAKLIATTDLTHEGRAEAVIESRSVLNSSEGSGSSQDSRTITSSDVKESTASNRSIESSSVDRPAVPELNLDSLQDNTVSSFKITANGTATKESNGSLRESDATTSLVEPLTPDERLTIGNRLADHEEDACVEELTENLSRGQQSEVPEADQLYRAEHAEYEWLEKDSLSSETDSDDKAKSQKDIIGSKALPEDDTVRVDTISREREEGEELGSEEEIARELIGSLDEEMQLCAKELDLKEETKDNEGSAENNLNVDDKSSQPLSESMRSISVDELGKREISSKEIETLDSEEVAKTDIISELSDHGADINRENEDRDSAITEREAKEFKSEVGEEECVRIQIAPLAQFEQDELLEPNGKQEMADEKITAENKPDINDFVFIDNEEKSEDKQTSVNEVLNSQSNGSTNKVKELDEKQEESEQDKSIDKKECVQDKLDVQKEREQEKSKIQEEEQGNMKLQEEVNVKAVPLEVTESREGSMEDSINDKDNIKHDETDSTKSITSNNLVTDDPAERDVRSRKEEKIRDLSAEVESVHGPITSAISEQSTEDHSHGRHWTMVDIGTKSSTVETVIAAFGSNASTETLGDAPESIEDKSISQSKDDFYSAVVKVQACIRGFLARRRTQKDLRSERVSNGNNVPLTQETATGDHLKMPEDRLRETRHRLRREEALRKTTLSLENAFATGRLQHTGEFHDSVPLILFDVTDDEDNSVPSNESLSGETEEHTEEKKPDVTESNTSGNDYGQPARDDEHRGSFQKDAVFPDHSVFPIVMHLLGDAPPDCHLGVNRNSDSGFNPGVGGAKRLAEPIVDILMLGYPRDDATLQNRYLNFITSVEDVGSNMDSLPLGETMKSSKNVDDAHPSITSLEGSLREPLALPGAPQGVVIEELTSLDEAAGNISMRSDSTKTSIAPKTSLDTNSSVPPEERALEDERNDLGTSPRTRSAGRDDVIGNRKNTDEKAEKQPGKTPVEATDCNGSVAGSHVEDTSKRSNDTLDSGEHAE